MDALPTPTLDKARGLWSSDPAQLLLDGILANRLMTTGDKLRAIRAIEREAKRMADGIEQRIRDQGADR